MNPTMKNTMIGRVLAAIGVPVETIQSCASVALAERPVDVSKPVEVYYADGTTSEAKYLYTIPHPKGDLIAVYNNNCTRYFSQASGLHAIAEGGGVFRLCEECYGSPCDVTLRNIVKFDHTKTVSEQLHDILSNQTGRVSSDVNTQTPMPKRSFDTLRPARTADGRPAKFLSRDKCVNLFCATYPLTFDIEGVQHVYTESGEWLVNPDTDEDRRQAAAYRLENYTREFDYRKPARTENGRLATFDHISTEPDEEFPLNYQIEGEDELRHFSMDGVAGGTTWSGWELVNYEPKPEINPLKPCRSRDGREAVYRGPSSEAGYTYVFEIAGDGNSQSHVTEAGEQTRFQESEDDIVQTPKVTGFVTVYKDKAGCFDCGGTYGTLEDARSAAERARRNGQNAVGIVPLDFYEGLNLA